MIQRPWMGSTATECNHNMTKDLKRKKKDAMNVPFTQLHASLFPTHLKKKKTTCETEFSILKKSQMAKQF